MPSRLSSGSSQENPELIHMRLEIEKGLVVVIFEVIE